MKNLVDDKRDPSTTLRSAQDDKGGRNAQDDRQSSKSPSIREQSEETTKEDIRTNSNNKKDKSK